MSMLPNPEIVCKTSCIYPFFSRVKGPELSLDSFNFLSKYSES